MVNVLMWYQLMEFPIKFDTVKSGWSIVYIEGSQIIISKKYCVSLSLKQTVHKVAFHLDLL